MHPSVRSSLCLSARLFALHWSVFSSVGWSFRPGLGPYTDVIISWIVNSWRRRIVQRLIQKTYFLVMRMMSPNNESTSLTQPWLAFRGLLCRRSCMGSGVNLLLNLGGSWIRFPIFFRFSGTFKKYFRFSRQAIPMTFFSFCH